MKKLFLPAVILLLTQTIFAQVSTQNKERFAAFKAATLYIPVADTVSAPAKAMISAIRSVWTVSPIKFISASQIDNYMKPGNAFVTLVHDNRSFNFMRESTNAFGEIHTGHSPAVDNDYFYLQFTVADEKETRSGKMKGYTIARAELYLQSIGTGKINFSADNLTSPGFQSEFCNGLPGYVKNMFQKVNNNVQNDIETDLKRDLSPQPGLARLKTDTLYVPNYWFGPGGTMLPDEPEESANGRYIRKMVAEYGFPLKLVRRDDLSRMILSATKPIYYFNYVQSSADKMVAITNGLTGETLYYDFNDKSYRPKGKDFEKMSRAVGDAN